MLAFFTRIPVRVRGEYGEAEYRKGIKYLPLIGVMHGILMGAAMLLSRWTGVYVSAFLALAAYLGLSGGLHVDGMADTADGFAAQRDREGTLAVMKDSRIGTFGVLAICLYAAGMVVCLAQAGFTAAALCPLSGRTAALLCARINKSATNGMGRWFVDGVKTAHIVFSAALFMAAAASFLLLCRWPYIAALTAAFAAAQGAAAFAVRRMARRLDGVTGDIIGFSIEFAQLVFLVLASLAINICQ